MDFSKNRHGERKLYQQNIKYTTLSYRGGIEKARLDQPNSLHNRSTSWVGIEAGGGRKKPKQIEE